MYKFNLKYFEVSFIFLSFLLGGCGGGGGDSGTTSKQKVSSVVERCPRILPPGISENLQFHVSGNTIYLTGAVSKSSIEFRDISAKPGILSVKQSGGIITISNCNSSDNYQQATLGGFYGGEKIFERKIDLPPRGTPVSHVLKNPNSDEYAVLVSPAAISDEGALKPELGSAYLGVMSLALSKDKQHNPALVEKTKQALQTMVVSPDDPSSYFDLEDFDKTAPVEQKTKLIERFVKQKIRRSPESFNDIVEGLSKAGIKSKVVKLSTSGSLQGQQNTATRLTRDPEKLALEGTSSSDDADISFGYLPDQKTLAVIQSLEPQSKNVGVEKSVFDNYKSPEDKRDLKVAVAPVPSSPQSKQELKYPVFEVPELSNESKVMNYLSSEKSEKWLQTLKGSEWLEKISKNRSLSQTIEITEKKTDQEGNIFERTIKIKQAKSEAIEKQITIKPQVEKFSGANKFSEVNKFSKNPFVKHLIDQPDALSRVFGLTPINESELQAQKLPQWFIAILQDNKILIDQFYSLPSGQKWFESERGAEWLATTEGVEWLNTSPYFLQQTLANKGKREKFLETSAGELWLSDEVGGKWLANSPEAFQWLESNPSGFKNMLENKDPTQLDQLLHTQNGQKWLKGRSGQQWLQQAQVKDGIDFKDMKSVDIWLKHFVTDPAVYFATEDEVIIFLQQNAGKYWLTTDHGKIWAISERGREIIEKIPQEATAGQTQMMSTGQEQEPIEGEDDPSTEFLLSEIGQAWLITQKGQAFLNFAAKGRGVKDLHNLHLGDLSRAPEWLQNILASKIIPGDTSFAVDAIKHLFEIAESYEIIKLKRQFLAEKDKKEKELEKIWNNQQNIDLALQTAKNYLVGTVNQINTAKNNYDRILYQALHRYLVDKIAEIEHAIALKDEELDRQELQQQQAANTEFFGTIFPAINPKNLADKIQYLRNYNTRGNIYLESRLHRMIYNLERQQKQAPKQTMQTESTEAKRRQQEEQRQQKFIEAVKTNLGIYQSHQAKVNRSYALTDGENDGHSPSIVGANLLTKLAITLLNKSFWIA